MGSVRTAAVLLAVRLACLLAAPAAGAAGPIRLVLDQGAAFSLLGHSCGGIQEQVYATGFGAGPGGYPEGDAYLSTRCGGSGRGGGYKITEYKATASVVWNWFGQTRSFARLEGPAGGGPEFSAEDSHGDRLYNVGSSAYLETGEPPLQPPAAPSAVQVSAGLDRNRRRAAAHAALHGQLDGRPGQRRRDHLLDRHRHADRRLERARPHRDRQRLRHQRDPLAARTAHHLPDHHHEHGRRRDERTEPSLEANSATGGGPSLRRRRCRSPTAKPTRARSSSRRA